MNRANEWKISLYCLSSSLPSVSLCRNGKMECVPEEKGNLPPPHSQQSSPWGCKLPDVCSCFLWRTARCRGILHSLSNFDPQSLTVLRSETVLRGKCTTVARSREGAWPVRQPAATWCWTSLALPAHPASLAASALLGSTSSEPNECNLMYYESVTSPSILACSTTLQLHLSFILYPPLPLTAGRDINESQLQHNQATLHLLPFYSF